MPFYPNLVRPLTLPSRQEFPSSLRGEGLGGGDKEIYSHLHGDEAGFYSFGKIKTFRFSIFAA
jgi:hypothetical protein